MLSQIVLVMCAATVQAIIEYPISYNTYTKLNDIHVGGPMYREQFNAAVCNINNYNQCKMKLFNYIGIGTNEEELSVFKYPIALLTYENTSLVHEYSVPVLGLGDSYIKYGLKSQDPFFVNVYQRNQSSLNQIYIILGVFGLFFCCFVYKHCANVCKVYMEQKRKEFKINNAFKQVNIESAPLLNTNCTICLDDFQEGDKLVELKECHHVFHKGCITTWFTQKQRCPNCQNESV